ncbi:MAG: hypothetical protein DFNUSKGM_002814 [Candidatus Fervidibacter sacchari]
MELVVEGNNTVKSASIQVIAPGDLKARNTLEEPNRVRPEPAEVQFDSNAVRFVLPPYSAGVVTVNLR